MKVKVKVLKIINEEINRFSRDIDKFIKSHDFARAMISAKALNCLKRMVKRIQDET